MMKLFKKLLAVAMVAVLALTVLTGCDTGTTDPDRKCCLCTEQWCGSGKSAPVDLQCEVQQDYKGTAG